MLEYVFCLEFGDWEMFLGKDDAHHLFTMSLASHYVYVHICLFYECVFTDHV